jgi:hypothetical protein
MPTLPELLGSSRLAAKPPLSRDFFLRRSYRDKRRVRGHCQSSFALQTFGVPWIAESGELAYSHQRQNGKTSSFWQISLPLPVVVRDLLTTVHEATSCRVWRRISCRVKQVRDLQKNFELEIPNLALQHETGG